MPQEASSRHEEGARVDVDAVGPRGVAEKGYGSRRQGQRRDMKLMASAEERGRVVGEFRGERRSH